MRYAESILDLVGRTPLVRITRVLRDLGPLAGLDPRRAERDVLDLAGDLRQRLRRKVADDGGAPLPVPDPAPASEWLIRTTWRSWKRDRGTGHIYLAVISGGTLVMMLPLMWPGELRSLEAVTGLAMFAWLLAWVPFGAASHLESQHWRQSLATRGEAPETDVPDPSIGAVALTVAIGSALLAFAFVMALVELRFVGNDLEGRLFNWMIVVSTPIQLAYHLHWTVAVVRRMFNWSVEQRRIVSAARASADRLKLSALQSQMQPHFLFNALNTIASLIRTAPAQAEQTLQDLRGMLRDTLDRHEPVWALEEEIAFVRKYLDIARARFGDRLAVSYEIEPGLGHVSVPVMSLQPLVENALKHAVGSALEGGRIRIVAKKRLGLVWLHVDDDGPGFARGMEEGIGLSNVRERLRTLYGSDAKLRLESSDGARVTIIMPSSPAAQTA